MASALSRSAWTCVSFRSERLESDILMLNSRSVETMMKHYEWVGSAVSNTFWYASRDVQTEHLAIFIDGLISECISCLAQQGESQGGVGIWQQDESKQLTLPNEISPEQWVIQDVVRCMRGIWLWIHDILLQKHHVCPDLTVTPAMQCKYVTAPE